MGVYIFLISITYLVIVLNIIFILKNKNRKKLFDNGNFILYFLILLIKKYDVFRLYFFNFFIFVFMSKKKLKK